MQAARLEAEKMLHCSYTSAGIGGNEVQVSNWHRGDRTCWLKPAQCSAALRIAADHLLSLQQGEILIQTLYLEVFKIPIELDLLSLVCCSDLAMWGYDVGGKPSIQLSMYPGDGARYGEAMHCSLETLAKLWQ